MATDDGWPQVWAEISDEELRTDSRTIGGLRQTVRIPMQDASRNSWPKPRGVMPSDRTSDPLFPKSPTCP